LGHQDPVSEEALLNLTARFISLPADRLDPTDLLDELEISTSELLILVAALEDRCDVVLPDCELARCETLGDLIDRVRAQSVPDAVLVLNDRADQPADTGRDDHGQRAPEGDPRRSAPGRRSTSFRPGHAEQRQAS